MRRGFSGRKVTALGCATALSGAMAVVSGLACDSGHALVAWLAVWVAVSFPLGVVFGHLSLD